MPRFLMAPANFGFKPERFVIVLKCAVVIMSRGVCVGSVVEREEEVRMREVSAIDRPE